MNNLNILRLVVSAFVLLQAGNSLPIDNTVESDDYFDLSYLGVRLFGEPDSDTTGSAVADYDPSSGVNPEELGSYFEGDILVVDDGLARNGLALSSTRWPNGVVPFVINGNFNAREMATIESSMIEYHTKTCIRFKPRTNEQDYISIQSGNSGCWSAVGRVGGKQEVNLQSPGCLLKRGTPMHELMHALGFLHEQNRHERDNFVSVRFENIDPKTAANFDKVSASKTNDFGVPYDYNSVMHYSSKAFSRNGQETIVALQNGNHNMGQRDGFSPRDIQKLNSMYNCNMAPAPSSPAAPEPARPNPNRPQGGNNIFLGFLNGLANGLGLKSGDVDNNQI